MEAYVGRQFVGIDLHRRRSVIVRTTVAGEVLESVRIVNDADRLTEVISRAGEAPEVVLEATYGWYWAVDALQAAGARVHLAHPLGVKAFAYRRVKNAKWLRSGKRRTDTEVTESPDRSDRGCRCPPAQCLASRTPPRRRCGSAPTVPSRAPASSRAAAS